MTTTEIVNKIDRALSVEAKTLEAGKMGHAAAACREAVLQWPDETKVRLFNILRTA